MKSITRNGTTRFARGCSAPTTSGRMNCIVPVTCALALLLAVASPGIAAAAGEAEAESAPSTSFDAVSAGKAFIEKAFVASRARNLQTVDPESLHPPAEIEDVPWFGPIPYDKCWKGASEITCVAYPRTFPVGDGSLAGGGGLPNDLGVTCDGGFNLYMQFQNSWSIVRFYTLNGEVMSRYRLERGVGTVYNSATGKAARLHFDDLFISHWSPPGDRNSEQFTIFGSPWSVDTLSGKTLAESYGYETFFADGTWQHLGSDPLDAYFFGDPSGVNRVCSYLK
jgi:hypothetical protein